MVDEPWRVDFVLGAFDRVSVVDVDAHGGLIDGTIGLQAFGGPEG